MCICYYIFKRQNGICFPLEFSQLCISGNVNIALYRKSSWHRTAGVLFLFNYTPWKDARITGSHYRLKESWNYVVQNNIPRKAFMACLFFFPAAESIFSIAYLSFFSTARQPPWYVAILSLIYSSPVSLLFNFRSVWFYFPLFRTCNVFNWFHLTEVCVFLDNIRSAHKRNTNIW